MKLSDKDKQLLKELVHCEIFAQEQSVSTLYDQKRVDRLKKLKVELS